MLPKAFLSLQGQQHERVGLLWKGAGLEASLFCVQAAEKEPPAAAKATFLLQLALRSFAGGNLAAAGHRLAASEEQVRFMVHRRGAHRVG